MRKDLISKEEEAKLILGLKLPSATERRLCFLHQQTNPEVMAASENFPGILPLFLETCAGPLQARKAHYHLFTPRTHSWMSCHHLVGTFEPPIVTKLLISALFST